MEDTLRVRKSVASPDSGAVLILVLMEDTLRVITDKKDLAEEYGLNPCFNGRYSQSSILL